MQKKFNVGYRMESLTRIVEIQKLRADYYETLETNKRTGDKTNEVRGEKHIEEFNLYCSLLDRGLFSEERYKGVKTL